MLNKTHQLESLSGHQRNTKHRRR